MVSLAGCFSLGASAEVANQNDSLGMMPPPPPGPYRSLHDYSQAASQLAKQSEEKKEVNQADRATPMKTEDTTGPAYHYPVPPQGQWSAPMMPNTPPVPTFPQANGQSAYAQQQMNNQYHYRYQYGAPTPPVYYAPPRPMTPPPMPPGYQYGYQPRPLPPYPGNAPGNWQPNNNYQPPVVPGWVRNPPVGPRPPTWVTNPQMYRR